MIVTSLAQFENLGLDTSSPIVLDVETYDKSGEASKLLGIALCDKNSKTCYVLLSHYNKSTQAFEEHIEADLCSYLRTWLPQQELVGHNHTYDKGWIEKEFDIKTNWVFDTRIGWHLASAPAGPRPYGLKDAQIEVLGWDAKGDVELEQNVKMHGGNLKKGDHYKADLNVLAEYAEKDALSTYLLLDNLCLFFDKHEYYWMMDLMMNYDRLLYTNKTNGVLVDLTGLEKYHARMEKMRESARKLVIKALGGPVYQLEKAWLDRRLAAYKRNYNRERLLAHPEEWERFNLNSDKHKRELFYDLLKFPVLEKTEGGQPATGADVIKHFKHPFVEPYLKYEKINTILSNFSTGYIEHAKLNGGRLKPGFNICGTVSYRLSGFKPYLLNAPFDEKRLMRNLKCDPGYIGVHADLSAIEPTITAHYSEDPSLLKVFRDGLGDIYLDLALELFPNDSELQSGYNPNIPITKDVKKKFEKQRKVAKVIQLAVQYTGTGHTVARNLTKDGIPTTVEEAQGYVKAYWRKFKAVARFNYQLKELNRQQGYLRNVIGRVIRVPDPDYKDLSNRFIQSSAHDVLILWVSEIYRLCEERSIPALPILLDCHDSTSNQVPVEYADQLESAYSDALHSVNSSLGLCVHIKAETKRFNTLAGLKGEE